MKRKTIGMSTGLVVLGLLFARVARAAGGAQDDAGADVDHLVVLTGEQSQIRRGMTLQFDDMKEQISRVAPDDAKPGLLKLVGAGNRQKAVDEALAVRKKFYTQNFTEDEIKQLVNLYESPAAKKLVQLREAASAAGMARLKRGAKTRELIPGDSGTLDRVRKEVGSRLRAAVKQKPR